MPTLFRIEPDPDGRLDPDAVIDTGVGIAAAQLERLTEPLYPTKARGLGLALAKGFSRGMVRRCRSPGSPARTARLPSGWPSHSRENDTMSGRARSVLLVDDDVDICANMADILSEFGYEVDVAHEGTAALEKVRRRSYDVALLDFRMPGMDGVTLCREIRRIHSGVVPMLVTAYANAETAREAADAGAWQILSKPVDLAALMSLVEEAGGQPLVLVVDDDPDLCANLEDLLGEHGFRVCVAHDEAGAVEKLSEVTRVVLLDLRLPGGDGAAVFHRIREANPEARVVLITGYRDELGSVVSRLLAQGVDAVHYKPFDIPRLLQDLDRLAGGGGSE